MNDERRMTAWRPVSLLVACLLCGTTVEAAQWPSLFRSLVVRNGDGGVELMALEESSQAFQVGLRPGDVIIAVDGSPTPTIEAFAEWSQRLHKEQRTDVVCRVVRAGQEGSWTITLNSYPVLQAWGIALRPDSDLRFKSSTAGATYWEGQVRAALKRNRLDDAIAAAGNALHYQPARTDLAVRLGELFALRARNRLERREFPLAVEDLERAIRLYQRALAQPDLPSDALGRVRASLEQVTATLRALTGRAGTGRLPNTPVPRVARAQDPPSLAALRLSSALRASEQSLRSVGEGGRSLSNAGATEDPSSP